MRSLFRNLTTLKAINLIILTGILVYFNTLFNGFVWDDISQIIENTSVHNLANVPSFFFGARDIAGNVLKIQAVYYRPLMASLFTIVYSIFGPNAFIFHLLSIIMHLAIAVLIFLFFRHFFKQSVAFFLALIFLIHPLNTEVVNYIGAYNDLLYFLFGFIALTLMQTNLNSFKKNLFIAISVFLTLLSKESGFLFIPVFFVFTFLYKEKKEMYTTTLTLVFTVIAYWLLRTSFYIDKPLNQALGFSPFLHMSTGGHLINIPKIFYYYIGNFFFPFHLAIAQHWVVEKITLLNFYFPLFIFLGLALINGYLFLYFRNNKQISNSVIFFSIWFWIGIGFYFQFLPLDMTVADRWFYFPIVGLLGLIGSILGIILNKKNIKNVLIILIGIYIAFITIMTFIRNTNWLDEFTLYTHDLKIESQSFDLENQLGIVYFRRNNLKEAKLHFEKSILLWQCSQAQNNLGYLNQQLGNFAVAEENYIKAVSCSGEYKSYGNLVLLLYKENNLDLAEHYVKQGLINYPNGAALYYILGLIQYKKGDKENALKNLDIGYKLSGDSQIMDALIKIQNSK
jgi:tetratricopeptide (TPR) repeat protein